MIVVAAAAAVGGAFFLCTSRFWVTCRVGHVCDDPISAPSASGARSSLRSPVQQQQQQRELRESTAADSVERTQKC